MKRRELVLGALALLVFWQLLAWALRVDILPGPLTVARAMSSELATSNLPQHFLSSLWRVVASMLLAVALAVPAGLVLGQSKQLNRIFAPVIYMLYPIPKVVFVPVLLLFFGIGDLSKILVIFLILFFQILVLVRDQAAALRPELILSVRSLGAGRRALFRFVYLPASLPAVLTALRQSVGTAVGCSTWLSCSPRAWDWGIIFIFKAARW